MSLLPSAVFAALVGFGIARPLPSAVRGRDPAGTSARAAGTADLAGRLAELRREESGPAPPAPAAIARRLDGIAVSYLEAGELDRAIELLAEAVARDPDNGVALAHLTLAYLRHGDYEFAEFYLELAHQTETRENPDPDFYTSLGDIYNAQNRTEDAITAWGEALRLGSRDPSVRERLARAQRDWAYAHGQRYYSAARFEYFYDPAIAESEVRAVDAFLESSADSLSEFFRVPSPPHSTVILYAGRRYFHLLETPDWVGGFYDGKIRVPLEPGKVEEEPFLGLLRHELAHAFLDRVAGGRAPAWLQEGIAQYVEGKRISNGEIAREAGRGGAKLEDLDQAFRQRLDRVQARLAYDLSLSFVQSLVKLGGTGAVVCAAADFGAGKPEREVFESNFGSPFETLLAEWRASIAAGRENIAAGRENIAPGRGEK